ncbi:MAG: protein-L-isoaspartate(D-aspartate) O-methyltransferase [Syntrophales bacterium]|nr:protein-L-isoaspartate(D-aspartate) O-methyltransferase [Syntrophales bacterium]
MNTSNVISLLFRLFLLSLCFSPTLLAANWDKARESMVNNQIIQRGIKDKATIQAMRKVPRHVFVPATWINSAYDDHPLPIGYGQTISQPYIVAYMTEIIKPKPTDRILEIGTGSGYQAAVLAEIVKEVFTVEIIPALGKQAEERLKKLGYRNIEVKIGDGFYGWPEKSPFDAIVVTAACEYIPPPLIQQLKRGGRMVIPVGSPFFVQTLILVEKDAHDQIYTKNLMPVRFVPLTRAKN